MGIRPKTRDPGDPVRWLAKPHKAVRRTPDMVLLARYPGLLRASTKSMSRLRPGSWRRKRLLERGFRNGFDANAKGRTHETLSFFHEDVELWISTTDSYTPPGTQRSYSGYDSFSDFFDLWTEVWHEWHLELYEFFDFGDRLAITATWVGRGAMSGIELRLPHAGIWTFRDGLCSKVELFWNYAEALETAGLPQVAEEYRADPPATAMGAARP